MQKIKEELNALVMERHERIDELSRQEDAEFCKKIKAKQQELSRAVCEGANDCPKCGGSPHGILQEGEILNVAVPYYEIGCLECGYRVKHLHRDKAVLMWNEGKDTNGVLQVA
jgi:hypothetical protein